MSSLRFLRPDDLLWLAAVTARLAPSGHPCADMDHSALKQWTHLYDTRPGNCMVLSELQEPHGVLLSARREEAGLIQELFIHPQRRRQGHGLEMIDSLIKKVAIQKLETMWLEAPDEPAAHAFATAAGFTFVETRADLSFSFPDTEAPDLPPGYALSPLPAEAVPAGGKTQDWYQSAPAFEKNPEDNLLFQTPQGAFALACQDGLLTALIPLENAVLEPTGLLALSHACLWADLRGLPSAHPIIPLIPAEAAHLCAKAWFHKPIPKPAYG